MDEAWLDLLNSDWHDYKGGGRDEDRLGRPEWRRRFLSRWPGAARMADAPAMVAGLRRLRGLLRRLADLYAADGTLGAAEIAALNEVLAGAPQVRRIVAEGGTFALERRVRQPSGPAALLAEIAASFAEILVAGEPRRIKLCHNPDCRWTFYDRSKNASRKWCENATGCGNLIKVRQFRARSGASAKRG